MKDHHGDIEIIKRHGHKMKHDHDEIVEQIKRHGHKMKNDHDKVIEEKDKEKDALIDHLTGLEDELQRVSALK